MIKKVKRGAFIALISSAIFVFTTHFLLPDKAEIIEEEVFVEEEFLDLAEPNYLFGFQIDSLSVFEEVVKPNQSLSQILSPFNVSMVTIDHLARNFKDVFDVRRIRPNQRYTVLLEEHDSTSIAKAFVFEPNKYEYLVFHLQDSIYIERQLRQVDTVHKSVAGVITNTLWESIISSGGGAALASALEDVYAWQIDFFRIQKNDMFKVMYEEIQVEGVPVGMGRILGAQFKHQGNDFFAVYYDQGQGSDYFDEYGNSLRKAFLKAPLKYSRISSRYNPKRFHPVLKQYKAHLGTDYAAPTGTPIMTVGDGIVLEAKYTSNNGYYVKVRHNSTYTTQYLHMSKIEKGMKPGAKVRQGEVIGYVGSTGLATGPHLCFRFWKNGTQVDALRVEIPPSEPINKDHVDFYHMRKAMMLTQLQTVDFPVIENQKMYARIN
jgi:murein DD-endopeptidase MepM/ murein hydrolase activator NlpD